MSDYDKKNAFDVEVYMEHRLILRADEEFELIEVNGNTEAGNAGDMKT